MKFDIPVIDLSDYLADRRGALATTAAQLRQALTEVGFFVLIGHGVSQSRIDGIFAEARRFHDQPMDWKLALKLNEHNNGYMTMGRYAVWSSDVNSNDRPDLNEAFFIKRERGPDDPLLRSGRKFVGPNVWPAESELPGFRAAALDYSATMDAFSRRLLPAVAVSLDLPPEHFDADFTDSIFSLRLSHYPPVAAEANQFGIAPHTDANFLTFLPQTEVPGLQIRTPSGEWFDMPWIANSMVVNSGDMMKRWTNGRFLSTPHRALPPIGRHRYAIPFFLGPRFDATIACLPSCTDAGNPPRWPPITYAEWLAWWYQTNYDPKVQQDAA